VDKIVSKYLTDQTQQIAYKYSGQLSTVYQLLLVVARGSLFGPLVNEHCIHGRAAFPDISGHLSVLHLVPR